MSPKYRDLCGFCFFSGRPAKLWKKACIDINNLRYLRFYKFLKNNSAFLWNFTKIPLSAI